MTKPRRWKEKEIYSVCAVQYTIETSTNDRTAKSKKQRRAAAKALRKRQLQDPDSLAPKVPLYEQTIDLYAGDGTVKGAMLAGAARQELTKAMRSQRRSKIRETNFLKTM